MDDVSCILDSYLEVQTAKQKSSVQDGSADRRGVRLMCWETNAPSRQNFRSLVLYGFPV